MRVASERSATQIVLSEGRNTWRRRVLGRSAVRDVARHAENVDIGIVERRYASAMSSRACEQPGVPRHAVYVSQPKAVVALIETAVKAKAETGDQRRATPLRMPSASRSGDAVLAVAIVLLVD